MATDTDTDEYGRNPLHLAAMLGLVDNLKKLLKKPHNIKRINNPDSGTQFPLLLAAMNGHAGVVEELLLNGADVNQQPLDGHTALHSAATNDCTKIMTLLLEAGAGMYLKDINGRTPMQLAVSGAKTNNVRLMLEAGYDINTTDDDGRTVLHLAAMHGHTEIVKQFLNAGADISAQEDNGRTPLCWAKIIEHAQVEELLLAWWDKLLLLTFAISMEKKAKEGHPRMRTALPELLEGPIAECFLSLQKQ